MLARIGLLAARRITSARPRLPANSKPLLSSRGIPSIRFSHQQRFASYQRFPGKGGSSGPGFGKFGPFARVSYIFQNYQKAVVIIAAGGGTFYVLNLENVPITHRRRFNIVSPELEKSMAGDGAYNQILQEYRGKILPESDPRTQMVARVVERLLPSTGGLAGDEWIVHVIDQPKEKNAFVMPGGKVFVFTGLLPIAQDETGLAVVLGHEIAHNVAHHVSERLSRSGFIAIFAIAGSLLFDVSGGMSQFVVNLLLSLPNSRTQEEEADHIGLLMMAQSCFDPDAAVDFWNRMHAAEQGAPPQFLSTHPSSSNRMVRLKALLPEAREKLEESHCGNLKGYAEDFKRTFGSKVPTGRSESIRVQQANGGDDDDFF